MKGDFTKLDFRPEDNFTGVREQQGRVRLDQDFNAADDITRDLRTRLARDTIGADVVGVPASAPGSLQVLEADDNGTRVQVTLNPGQVWIDGVPLVVPGTNPSDRTATYFGPPIQSPQAAPGEIEATTRDAVILEVWEDSFSAFQDPSLPDPSHLIESALGGPDTTARVQVNHTLRLLRLLDPEDDCGNLAGRLRDDFEAKGHLTVTPAPALSITGDCPVESGGGYIGFEHYLYRIEVAEPDAGDNPRFKWSRFNGSLVGRGTLDNVANEIAVLANDQMINRCGLADFHLEVLAPGPADDPGRWRLVMRADATLVADSRLALANIQGTWPVAGGGEAFFRLWDGIARVSDFPTGLATPNSLPEGNGIRLEFDAPAADNSNYTPGDFWTFPVRAAGVDFDPAVWPGNAPPQGIHYHRAPLAILNWSGAAPNHLTGSPAIHDCRRVFEPLTRLQTCCTFKVGDGQESFGDFDRIQDAIDHLPLDGGQICVLPGTYRESVEITHDNVSIHGCGERSRVIAPGPVGEGGAAGAVFHIVARQNICIEDLYLEAASGGAGILAEANADHVEPDRLVFERLMIQGSTDSGIKVLGAQRVRICECRITMADEPSQWPGVFLRADDVLVEHNVVRVEPSPAEGDRAAGVRAGRGGVHIAGTSDRVQLVDNHIIGGIGNGITLGTVGEINAEGAVVGGDYGWIVNADDPCDPCAPGSVYVPPGGGEGARPTFQSAGALYDLRIERNRIEGMGLNGIGVVAFFNLAEQDEFISVVGLDILNNRITGCLQRPLEPPPEEVRDFIGFGGIALADVEQLRLYDNVIEDNGPDHLQPVCGVFVLHGEGLDISRNRIVNNGAKTEVGAADAVPGQRGGILIVYALPGLVPLPFAGQEYPRQNGVPAIRVHDNIVSQPLGRALSIGALGPVSVQGNALTSRGLVPGAGSPGFVASTVFIFNYGLPNDLYLQLAFFSGVSADPMDAGPLPRVSDEFIARPAEGLDDARLGQYLASGDVMFTNNQVVADLMELEVSYAVSSVMIFTLDDVVFTNNQLECSFLFDFLLSNAIIAGMSVRNADNRFEETLILTFFSSIGLGLFFNHTVDNQATHCILNLQSPLTGIGFFHPELRERDNMVLFDWLSEGFCALFSRYQRMLVRAG